MISAEMLNCKLLSAQAAGIFTFCSNGQLWQNSSQNSVFWRGAKWHWQVAEFLLYIYKRMIKSKFGASNTLLNSAEYAITRKEHFSFLAFLPLSVLLLSTVSCSPQVHSHDPSIRSHRGTYSKRFDQISVQWESQENRFALISFGKIKFLRTCIWNLQFMSYHLRFRHDINYLYCSTCNCSEIFQIPLLMKRSEQH